MFKYQTIYNEIINMFPQYNFKRYDGTNINKGDDRLLIYNGGDKKQSQWWENKNE